MCWLLTTCEEEGEWRRRVKGRTHFSLFLLHPFKSFFYHTRGSVQQQQLVITNWRDAEKKREREEGILFGREFECPTRETRNTHKFSWCFSFSLSLSRSGVFLLGEGRSRILNGWWCGCESTGGRLNLVPIEEGSGGRKKKANPQQWKKKHTHTHTDIWGPDEMRALEKTEKSSSFFHLPSPFAAFPLFCLTSREPKLAACTHHPGHGLGAKAHGAECRLKNHFHSMDVVGVAKRERER